MLKRIFRSYNSQQVEQKWQSYWETNSIQKREGPKFYCLPMFPYPSGQLHIGHVRVYAISDAAAKFEHLRGKRVLHPMGWDSFGLPAENAANEKGIDPASWTERNIVQMKLQIKKLGFTFDWDKEISTCSQEYYKWTQEIFLKLKEAGLAYRGEGYINWDPVDQTVLANEQVDEEGRSWRSGALVERKTMKQWFLRITAYADELLKGLKAIDWPVQVKEMQRGWIGKSKGTKVYFEVKNTNLRIPCFTTRPETVYGVTFVAIAPEHSLVSSLELSFEEALQIEAMKTKLEYQRKLGTQVVQLSKVKAVHPLTGETLPVVVAEYCLMHYGTGCVMGVPAEDPRDYKVARLCLFPIKKVIKEGLLVESDKFTGTEAKPGPIANELKKKGCGKFMTCFRLRDWLVSRQRYWGVPIPVIYCNNCGLVGEKNLPLSLPSKNTKQDWLNTHCPKCGEVSKREADTLDTFVDSAWYYLRYPDNSNSKSMFDSQKVSYWTPVDLYIGGTEHAIMHLLYSRFIHKFLRDKGLVDSEEPFSKLLTQGLVLGPTYKHKGKYLTREEASCVEEVAVTYEKMSKSKKNGVNPLEITEEWGADVLRLAILFAAPSEKQIEWNEKLLKTMKRWLNKVEQVVESDLEEAGDVSKWVKGVTGSMERHKFHVVIARLMELTEELRTKPHVPGVKALLVILHPFAPHFSSEMFWNKFHKDIRDESWPYN